MKVSPAHTRPQPSPALVHLRSARHRPGKPSLVELPPRRWTGTRVPQFHRPIAVMRVGHDPLRRRCGGCPDQTDAKSRCASRAQRDHVILSAAAASGRRQHQGMAAAEGSIAASTRSSAITIDRWGRRASGSWFRAQTIDPSVTARGLCRRGFSAAATLRMIRLGVGAECTFNLAIGCHIT